MLPDNAVENIERRGQGILVKDDTLPIKGVSVQYWEKQGFVFLAKVDGIFNLYKFPEGWKKVPAKHPMYVNLVNDKGGIVAEIFYKAAPYDRRADITLKDK